MWQQHQLTEFAFTDHFSLAFIAIVRLQSRSFAWEKWPTQLSLGPASCEIGTAYCCMAGDRIGRRSCPSPPGQYLCCKNQSYCEKDMTWYDTVASGHW